MTLDQEPGPACRLARLCSVLGGRSLESRGSIDRVLWRFVTWPDNSDSLAGQCRQSKAMTKSIIEWTMTQLPTTHNPAIKFHADNGLMFNITLRIHKNKRGGVEFGA